MEKRFRNIIIFQNNIIKMNHIKKFLANDTKGFEARKYLFEKA